MATVVSCTTTSGTTRTSGRARPPLLDYPEWRKPLLFGAKWHLIQTETDGRPVFEVKYMTSKIHRFLNGTFFILQTTKKYI